MTRSSWKGIVMTPAVSTESGTVSPRNTTVMPSEIGKSVLIHNGKSLFSLVLNKYMLYKKLGTLSYTKKLCVFRRKKGKKKKK
jgi:ribosomal protein S19